ncbi:Deoxyribodipyrimidine photolyase [Klebsiella pneumoniae subsp. ozaenae]|uniref:Deoxyribodipyrimidine photolyase n=1 Tax=Klebsiella pneumoniae subsp. ozaenae TaxID=574 RepID=A0A378BVL8_KLEPO|nr:Deoxyribodipyrimidine photolyase [Klebsiella pneumoniae subsp. ozaenae]
MYKVFTPFKNAFIRRLRDGLPACVAAPKPRQAPARQAPPLPELYYPQTPFDGLLFAADEKTALARLRAFCQQAAADYEGAARLPGRGRDQSACRPAWPSACCPPASACIVC